MTAREWFQKAQDENFAIGAFNVDNLEILNAILIAAKKKKSPIMLEFSQGEVGYFGLYNVIDIIKNARSQFDIPILLNLDHAKKVEDCLDVMNIGSPSTPRPIRQAQGSGSSSFDDVHFDGSDLPYEENVKKTKEVVEAAHMRDLLVEGEIDKIAGSSEVHLEELDTGALKKSYTDPAKAAKFVAETGIDIFAAFFGNVHGTFPTEPNLDLELLKRVKEALPSTFLSLHGGSGIPARQVREAIDAGGIVKVNVNTEVRQAFRDALSEELSENPEQVAYYKLTPDIINAVVAVVEGKIDVFGSAGKA